MRAIIICKKIITAYFSPLSSETDFIHLKLESVKALMLKCAQHDFATHIHKLI